MRDFNRKELEASRPDIELKDGVDFCLARLYEDQENDCIDEFVRGLSFEELIGVLLLMRDYIDSQRDSFNSSAWDT